MKIHPVDQVAPCGQKNRHEETSHNFANAPKTKAELHRMFLLGSHEKVYIYIALLPAF